MDLPQGWQWVPVRDLGTSESDVVIGPFGSSLKVSDYRDSGTPLIFVKNIRSGDFRTGRRYVSPAKALELRAHEVLPGDVLVTKMGDPPGDAAVYREREPAIVTADCIRIRPRPDVLPAYVSYAMATTAVRQQVAEITRGVAQRKVSLGRFRQIRLPVAPSHEQQRIVEILEDHLSRLDAAESELALASARSDRWTLSALWKITHVAGAPSARLDSIAEVKLGRQRSPRNHSGTRMRPYLRAANVHWNRLRLDDIKEMNFSEAEEATFALQRGDILVVEASGSAAEVGKSAILADEVPGACFQNTLLRVRCTSSLPGFVQKYLLAEALAGRLVQESRGVGIHHIGRARLAALPIMVPNEGEQARIAEDADTVLAASERVLDEIEAAHSQGRALRQALLAAAFTGRLTGRASDEEVVQGLAGV